MPELPECEENRRRVAEACLNRTIERVQPGNDTAHCDLPDEDARARLVGRQFSEARRHGKTIFAGSHAGPWLVVHLGMAGSLRPFDESDGAPDYTRLTVIFEGDRRLAFRDPRKFGALSVVDDWAAHVTDQGLGPDAMEISRDAFREAIGGTRGAVKSALMAQGKVAGIGNLWADETLFQTGVHPNTRADALDEGTLDALYDASRRIMQGVIDVRADYAKLPDAWLISHREVGAECRRCGATLEKTKVGGRTSYFCPKHQTD